MSGDNGKPRARRCTSCGKFLAATSTETQCEACLAREVEEAAAPPGERATAAATPGTPEARGAGAAEPELAEEPVPPRPSTSWPPRAPAAPLQPRQQVPPPPAAAGSGALLEPGIVIPRPSQLHPSSADPVRAALEAPEAAPPTPKRSRWGLPKRSSTPKPPPPAPMQAVPRALPAVAPRSITTPQPTVPAVRQSPGIVQPLAPATPPATAPSAQPAEPGRVTSIPVESRAASSVVTASAVRTQATLAPPAPTATDLPASSAPAAPQPSRAPRFAPSRAGVVMATRVAIAICIGLLAGLVVPFLVSR